MKNQLKQPTIAVSANRFSMLFSSVADYVAGSRAKSAHPLASIADLKRFTAKLPSGNIKGKFQKTISSTIRFAKRHPKTAAVLLIVLALAFLAYFNLLGNGPKQLVSTVTNSQTNFSPDARVAIGKKLEIPIRTAKGEETKDKLVVNITDADRSRRILIQGKPATARDTKSFLIINMEIENSTINQLTVRPIDFVRLQDGQGRNFAPDVHNEEVIVEPTSIKKTRVGFVVEESQNSFKFLFGELNGPKETIGLTI